MEVKVKEEVITVFAHARGNTARNFVNANAMTAAMTDAMAEVASADLVDLVAASAADAEVAVAFG